MAVRQGLQGFTIDNPPLDMGGYDPSLPTVMGDPNAGLQPDASQPAPPPMDMGGAPAIGAAGRQTPFFIPPTAFPIDWSKIAQPMGAGGGTVGGSSGALEGVPTSEFVSPYNYPMLYGGIEGGEPGGPPGGGGGGTEPPAPPSTSGKLHAATGSELNDLLANLFGPADKRTQWAGSSEWKDVVDILNNKMGDIYDPNLLKQLEPWFNANGYKLQKDSNGGIRGRIYDKDGNAFDLMSPDGKWAWIPRGKGGETAAGGAGGGGGRSAGGAGYSLNAGMSQAIDDALMRMLTQGMGPFGNATWDWLQRVLNTGGLYNDPLVKAQLIKARDAEARAFNSQLADARAALADRGLISAPGAAQGSEVGAVEHITNTLGADYAANVSQIEIQAMDRANQNMMSALSLATGLSEAQASNILSAIGLGTQRQVALADLSLRQLELDQNFQMFLANYGLSVDTLRYQIQNNNFQQVLALIMAFLQHVQVGAGGQI